MSTSHKLKIGDRVVLVDADVSYGLREIYAEPPEGTRDAWLVADVSLVCAAYEMMRCERDALLRKAGAK